MRRRVTTAPEAARAFAMARQWLLQAGSGPDGNARWAALRQARRTLLAFPCIGEVSSEFPGFRQRAVSGYRIVYLVDGDTGDYETSGDVRVVALFGPGQR